MGSGKSSVSVFEILRRAGRQKPGPDGVRRTRWAVIRNTYSQLRDTTWKTFQAWVPPELGKPHLQSFTWFGKWNDGEYDVDCEVLFRSLDRPDDVGKLLSLELTGAYINEAREIPKQIVDMLKTRLRRYPDMASGGPSWSGIWMDTNPWPMNHWGYKLFSKDRPNGFELFEQPGARSAEAENLKNLDPRYYIDQMAGVDAEWISCYIDAQYPDASVGSVYGKLIGQLRKRNGLRKFDHLTDKVCTSWDIGYSDSTAIWFWRINEEDRQLELIDHVEGHLIELSRWFRTVEDRGYQYYKHFLPHDARNANFQTRLSVFEQAMDRWPGKVVVVPRNDVEDGIAAARWLLETDMRVHSRCAEGLETLAAYRYEWDDESQTFGVRPVHDFSSHTADAFRYLACVVKMAELLTRPAPKAPPLNVRGHDHTWTLEQLFKDNEQSAGRRRI